MTPRLHNSIEVAVHKATGQRMQGARFRSVSGGCIHHTMLMTAGEHSYFIKVNAAHFVGAFAAEADALRAMRATRSIYAPEPLIWDSDGESSFLIMEALTFGRPAPADWQNMGQQLAALHANHGRRFGWNGDNWIGGTRQHNRPLDNWADFFRECRLRPQIEVAHHNGYRLTSTEALLAASDWLLKNHHPDPSLLHGDLWSGNAAFLQDGCPVVYDPASYYGDRETDLAFTEFFGGFAPKFYEAYSGATPLPPGYTLRKDLYNLYHLLNHVNLFGGSYVSQAQQLIARLVGAASGPRSHEAL